MKECRTCYITKPMADYYRNKSSKDGHSSECKSCESTRKRTVLKASVIYVRRAKRKAKYGLSDSGYESMLESQDFECAICHLDIDDYRSDYFPVDHSHVTGKVRGLLCGKCNTGLGMFGDSIPTLKSAVEYLKNSEL